MSKQLVLHSLSKKYNKSEKFANENINLTFFSGEISTITGHNGAGKTTMLNQVIGITKPSKGSITFNGKSFVTESKVAREYVSMMPQLHAPLNGVTMSQSIRSILRIRGLSEKEVKKETTKILKELAINDWKDTPGQKLSGGLRRLTSFAMTVAYPAPILLLDEPTNDVDPIRRQIIWKHLRKLAKSGHIIIVVTHNLLEVEKYADRYILMNNGKVLEDKRLQERSLEGSRLNKLVVNFSSEEEALCVKLPKSLNHTYNSEEVAHEFDIEAEEMVAGIFWLMQMIEEKKVVNYSFSPKSLNETYGEMINGDDEE
ncbi:ABC transporter ATP-binding protein [Brochothrix thermosphacta]|uniref:ABC transporter ATP-binding protein n=1 Tax=Brochothrix thermosphacta TaxID=2756 RepID=UPI00083F8C56|nr:ABC transporter ATP-binding protein [Brochothrix thermosphacta]ODJ47783.1 ABC transporter ATP-binding protein [Brochothrix thermosphacta]ODJ61784.1 ABC transporter ATP-binding protein [Brochothrix thermosphacta]